MRYLHSKVFFAAMLITLPLQVFAGCGDCTCEKQKINSPVYSTCDTYITNSRTSQTLQYTESQITEQVQKLLANQSGLPDITVITANGVVILSGIASTQAQIDTAAHIASTVPCVTLVDTSKFNVQ